MTARSGRVARAVRRALRDADPAPNAATAAVLLEQGALVDLLADAVRAAASEGGPVPAVPLQYLALVMRDLHAVLPGLDGTPDDELSELMRLLRESGDAAAPLELLDVDA